MKHSPFASGAALFALIALTACATDSQEPLNAETNTVLATDGDALSADVDRGYYIARRDTRRCASPMCGGLWVRAVNQKSTLCADGRRSAECYVADITLARVGLSQREAYEFRNALGTSQALVRAAMTSVRIAGRSYGRLNASEAWLGASGAVADGTFFRAADNGLRCITTPCPTTGLRPLNTGATYNALGVDLTNTTPVASAQNVDTGMNLAATSGGVLFVGGVALPKCRPEATDCGPRGMASEFYLPVKHTEGISCGARIGDTCGEQQYCAWAAGDLCGAADAPGRCAYRPQMCPSIYQPVCSCDGTTYSNACGAGIVGASILHDGPCR